MGNPVNQRKFSEHVDTGLIYVESKIKSAIILGFPLSVISTNRILNSPISRRGTSNSLNPLHLWHDAVALVKIGGYRSLLAGLLPTLAFYVFTNFST